MQDFKGKVNRLLSVAIPTFGEQVEYRPTRGGRYSMQAVFDDEYRSVDPDSQTVVSTNLPRIGVNLADLPWPPDKGDLIYIRGETFKLYDSQEDGQGGATLFMHKLQEDESYERTT